MKTRFKLLSKIEKKLYNIPFKVKDKFSWIERQKLSDKREQLENVLVLYHFLSVLRLDLERFCSENYKQHSLEDIVNKFSEQLEETLELDGYAFKIIFKDNLIPHIEHFVKMYFKKVEQHNLKLEL